MKNLFILPAIIIAVSFLLLSSCSKNRKNADGIIVVISDIHLGDSRAQEQDYAWFGKNKDTLITFLNSLPKQNVKTLVIAGDLFDEWVAPIDVSAYSEGKTRKDFILDIKESNKEILDAISRLKIESKINIYYVNGNHDIFASREDIDVLFGKDNIVFCSDFFNAETGLGTFYSEKLKLIIEHGHRYDFFNAPYKQVRKDKNGQDKVSFLPPGFFAAKLSASASLEKENPLKLDEAQGRKALEEFVKIEKSNATDIPSKLYALAWTIQLKFLSANFNEEVKTGIDIFEESFRISDFAPYLLKEKVIDKRAIFKTIEKDWEQTQKINGIDGIKQPFVPFAKALLADGIISYFDDMAKSQYFDNPKSDIRIVVFGHSHEAKLIAHYADDISKKSIYANSGTWIDKSKITRNYVLIKPQKNNSEVLVGVYQLDDAGNTSVIGEDSIAIKN